MICIFFTNRSVFVLYSEAVSSLISFFYLKIYMNLYGDLIWGYKILELEFQSTVRPLIIKHNCLPLIAQLPTPINIASTTVFCPKGKMLWKKYFFQTGKNFEIEIKIFSKN